MARNMIISWMEVAPSPIIYPPKPSNTPQLETIVEEIEEEKDGDKKVIIIKFESKL
ncbi:hypothetical protein CDL12_03905 [Handroanthus impetiginosus]|uniref:Uncharacterized protein n=1 Tax=Handroanthus impetiginosus TaxID=429701 RepID=A0A2G9I0U5_9LAMI|nr:hypothetical protein CDL12_03905 [Handroanthus impetiginosus]